MDVSVIIPMYNAESTVNKSIESVLNQTYDGEMEIIIVNDGSKDNSQKVAENIIEGNNSDVNIKLINKLNGGVSSARNAGLKAATGKFIAFLDSDDEWYNNKIETQIKLFTDNPSFGLIGGLIFEPAQELKGKLIEIKLSQMMFKSYFQPSTVVIKKEVRDAVGFFDETQKYAEEGNYFMRVANQFRCGLFQEKFVLYDSGKQGFGGSRGLSSNLKEMEKGELKNLKFAYGQGFISLPKYGIAVLFSIIKYIRRLILVRVRV